MGDAKKTETPAEKSMRLAEQAKKDREEARKRGLKARGAFDPGVFGTASPGASVITGNVGELKEKESEGAPKGGRRRRNTKRSRKSRNTRKSAGSRRR